MPEKHVFTDLVDLDIIQGLLEQFHCLTEMPLTINDVEGNILLSVGFKTICEKFHRVHPLSRKRCTESDRSISRQISATGEYTCSECLNGLVDVAIPIDIDGHHSANLFIGQFFLDHPPSREQFIRQAEECGFDKEAYLASLEEVPVFDRNKVEIAATFLGKLAQLLGETALSNKRLASFNENLEQEVLKHTERLGREQELRMKTLAEFEAIFDNAPVAIAFLKEDRIVHKINAEFERFTGYSKEELIGQKPIAVYRSSERFEDFGQAVYPLLAAGESVAIERRFKTKDGRAIWTTMHGKCLDPPRVRDGVIWFLTDITERKELEMLKEDVERITRHDLKVPLSGITGLCQSLLIDDNLTEEQRADIKLIEESGFRMNNQIAQSLELYKIETGTYDFLPAPVDMRQCVHKSLRDLSHKAERRQVEFVIEFNGKPDGDNAPVIAGADPMLAHSMFSNLISNAVEAAPDGSTVTIDMRNKGDSIETSVHNRGAVPEAIRATFFDKYVTSGKTDGTGLGTYTAKLMAKAQSGSISMETDDVRGTTVTVTLPAVADD